MNQKYITAGIAIRIWLFTNFIFGICWTIYLLLFENEALLWTALPATIIALIGSIPVLVTLFISLYFIKKSTTSLQNKYFLLVTTCLLSELPYAAMGGSIFSHELRIQFAINSYFICLLICLAVLFGASAIAITLINKRIIHFFSTSKNNQLMEQNSFQTDSNLPASNNSNTSNKTVIKGLITGALTLLMLIPVIFVMNLVSEREARQKEVTQEISSKWAAPQTLTGPYLYLPYKITVTYKDGKTGIIDKSLFLLPENLQVTGSITPEIRPRSIYKVLLYKSEIKNTGNFLLQLPKDISPAMVNFAEAKVCFGIRDFKGIQEKIAIRLNGISYELSPGLPTKERENIVTDNSSNSTQPDVVERSSVREIETIGLSAGISLSAADFGKSISFDMPVKINGSEQLHFVPLAGNSTFSLTSTWADPKFDGNNLPASRNVTPQGFSAKWNFNKANLPFGTIIKDFDFKKEPFAFGVTMVQPADQYAKTMRSVKYAILFIGLTFALFFIIELMQKNPVHPVQYVLVGLALVIFFTLLLSISEFILFDFAYLIAAVATIVLITLYAKGHFRSIKTALVFATVLSCLYSFIFVLIRLEDTALLVGSIGLFIVLAIVMYASRKIQWYGNEPMTTTSA